MPTTITKANSVFTTTATNPILMNTGDTLTVDFGGYLMATAADAIVMNGASQAYTLNINGSVESFNAPMGAGVYLSQATSSATINVGLNGSIKGPLAIATIGTASINNQGLIANSSTSFAAINEDGNGDYAIINSGVIANNSATGGAIKLNGSGTHTINNSGVINVATNQLAIAASAVLAGVENLTNTGRINGGLDLGAGIDTVHNEQGIITGITNLGDGDDFYFGSSNSLISYDYVAGGAGNDTISTFAGDDILNGGLGNDTMTGGLGNDIYAVDAQTDVINEIAGGGTGDRVQTTVSYSLDVAATSDIEFLETLIPSGTTAINLTGNTLANTITGNAGNNILNGGMDGAVDKLIGGAGDDTYVIRSVGDIITEVVGGGTDTAMTSVSYTLGSTAHVENLMTTGATGTTAINLYGNALLGQTITGNAGNNSLGGGSDNFVDSLNGGLGDDYYYLGNSTNDTITDTGGIDTAESYITRSLASFTTVEHLNLKGVGVINGTGNALDNTIIGNNVANVLDGSTGADTLNGALGNDTLTGGAGADIFVFNKALNATSNKDTISDFTAVDDIIHLENSVTNTFNNLAAGALAATAFVANATGVATTAAQMIVYNTATGALSYDSDGSGALAAVQFATLTGAPTITNADFLVI